MLARQGGTTRRRATTTGLAAGAGAVLVLASACGGSTAPAPGAAASPSSAPSSAAPSSTAPSSAVPSSPGPSSTAPSASASPAGLSTVATCKQLFVVLETTANKVIQIKEAAPRHAAGLVGAQQLQDTARKSSDLTLQKMVDRHVADLRNNIVGHNGQIWEQYCFSHGVRTLN